MKKKYQQQTSDVRFKKDVISKFFSYMTSFVIIIRYSVALQFVIIWEKWKNDNIYYWQWFVIVIVIFCSVLFVCYVIFCWGKFIIIIILFVIYVRMVYTCFSNSYRQKEYCQIIFRIKKRLNLNYNVVRTTTTTTMMMMIMLMSRKENLRNWNIVLFSKLDQTNKQTNKISINIDE